MLRHDGGPALRFLQGWGILFASAEVNFGSVIALNSLSTFPAIALPP
jgi:hypothetical protein